LQFLFFFPVITDILTLFSSKILSNSSSFSPSPLIFHVAYLNRDTFSHPRCRLKKILYTTRRWEWLLGRIGYSITHHYPLYPMFKYYPPIYAYVSLIASSQLNTSNKLLISPCILIYCPALHPSWSNQPGNTE
jgi:hypothetical protein